MVRKGNIRIGLVASAMALTAAAGAFAGTPGQSGLLALRIGVGGREAGMGEAGVASSRGASALYWNAANNVFADFDTELLVQHNRYLGAFNQEAAMVAHRIGASVIGVSFMGLYSDAIDRYSLDNTGLPEGQFDPYDVALGVSYARPLGDRFGIGANAKLIYEKIDIDSGTGLAFDFFLSHKALIDGLMFGASVTNFGRRFTVASEPFDLPTAVRVGAAWTAPNGALAGKLTLAGDVYMPNDTREKALVGAEYRLLPEFALRVGTRINYDNQGMTAGAGFKSGQLGVDYAYSESKLSGFDGGHKFSLNLVW